MQNNTRGRPFLFHGASLTFVGYFFQIYIPTKFGKFVGIFFSFDCMFFSYCGVKFNI